MPPTCGTSIGAAATDAALQSTYGPLGQPLAVFGHIHQSFVRKLGALTVVNTGSVSQSFDGDPRAAYLLVDDGQPTMRRVEYHIEREIKAMTRRELPHADWLARTIRAARPQMP